MRNVERHKADNARCPAFRQYLEDRRRAREGVKKTPSGREMGDREGRTGDPIVGAHGGGLSRSGEETAKETDNGGN